MLYSKFLVVINADYAEIGIDSTFIKHITKEDFNKLS